MVGEGVTLNRWIAILSLLYFWGILTRETCSQDIPIIRVGTSMTGTQEPASAIQEDNSERPTLPETVVEPEAMPPETLTPNLFNSGDVSQGFGAGALRGRSENLIGQTPSASKGRFGQEDNQRLPLNRPGDVLQYVPGMIATQHSGTGKANQYFVRGINLDHGTDFNVRVDGIPINLPSPGHGQGYLDINWLIPELIDHADYQLGPYYADVGDFSSAGALNIRMRNSLPHGIAKVTAGKYDYYRGLVANSQPFGAGELLYAYESIFYDGPWDLPEDYNKFNGMLKWTVGDELEGLSISAIGYHSYWNATNQIPIRAVETGLVGRFGTLDPTDAGRTSRAMLNLEYWYEDTISTTRANAYVAYYDMNLYSNFTFFLEDPVNGDQIEQLDERVYMGANLSQAYRGTYADHTLGFQFRNDNVFNLGLNRSRQQQAIESIRDDNVDQQSFSFYYENEAQLTCRLRSYLGLRADFYRFHTRSLLDPVDTGTTSDSVFSPKLGLIFEPVEDTELYANWGQSFHSNDARGVNRGVDPANGLVKSDGSEIGARTWMTPTWNATLAAWYLELDSELLFVGDAGTTEAGPASHRFGLTLTNNWQITDWLLVDADYALVRPRFTGGDRIPNAVENVLSTGFSLRRPESPFYASLWIRHYGPAALLEDNSARSATTTLSNLQVGYETDRLNFAVDIFNLFDREDNDITYFYESQPIGLPAANDLMFHSIEPLMARASLTLKF